MRNTPGIDSRRAARPRVLVADENPLVREVVRAYLERDVSTVVEVGDGDSAAAALDGRAGTAGDGGDGIDLAVLDACLPGRSGLEICRAVRSRSHRPDLPIILISGLGAHDRHRVLGLEAGADDYVAKPFSPRELALRVAAVLRRSPAIGSDIRYGDVRVLPGSQAVLIEGVRVNLTAREYELLVFLLRHPHRVFSRVELLTRVWGWEFGDLSTVTVHVKRLRAKLGAHHRISTVWGRGYSWGRDDAIDAAVRRAAAG
ncbi:response regulator transcription factor [Nocardia sp. BMG51109]|uniref:response regulator transcription factor n=1 Tax=Nocardia sp. BMG51109 TaxID=1056816 RepID=UPI000688F7BB|nr:response regulator transcription factor [Nocardia sp. BMG51109]